MPNINLNKYNKTLNFKLKKKHLKNFPPACGDFPIISNGTKIVLSNVTVNSSYVIETKVKYKCDDNLVYTGKYDVINCTDKGTLDGHPGECVPGIYYMCSIVSVQC